MIELLADLLREETRQSVFCMAVMIQSSGSTPRSSGSRMLIFPDGTIQGTIGGGKLEGQVMNAARDVIHNRVARVLNFEFTGKDAASLDMICGGSAKILLEPVGPESNSFWEALHQIKAASMHHNTTGWLVTEVDPDHAIRHAYYETLPAFLAPAVKSGEPAAPTRSPGLREQDGALCFTDPLASPSRVYIFGAGHVSQALAAVAKIAGFQIFVVDDRDEFANRKRFPDCDEVFVMDPITDIFQSRTFSREDMIVIVTRGHLQDQVVLESALKTGAGYIGMIGSKRKRELLYQSLRENGVQAEQIARVHSPIGMKISAETPEEIAVSITAELIQQRAVLRAG